jgi:hypothetical protein
MVVADPNCVSGRVPPTGLPATLDTDIRQRCPVGGVRVLPSSPRWVTLTSTHDQPAQPLEIVGVEKTLEADAGHSEPWRLGGRGVPARVGKVPQCTATLETSAYQGTRCVPPVQAALPSFVARLPLLLPQRSPMLRDATGGVLVEAGALPMRKYRRTSLLPAMPLHSSTVSRSRWCPLR